MKYKILFAALSILFFACQTYVLAEPNLKRGKYTTITECGTCSKESHSESWTSTITYNSKGQPLEAAGIDCSGHAWVKKFNVVLPTDSLSSIPDSIIANISSVNDERVVVTSNYAPLAFVVVNLQSGLSVSENYSFTTANTDLVIDITGLEPALYGIVVYFQGVPINMLKIHKY